MREQLTEPEIVATLANLTAGTHMLSGGSRDSGWSIACHGSQFVQHSWTQDQDGHVRTKENSMSPTDVAETLRRQGRRIIRPIQPHIA